MLYMDNNLRYGNYRQDFAGANVYMSAEALDSLDSRSILRLSSVRLEDWVDPRLGRNSKRKTTHMEFQFSIPLFYGAFVATLRNKFREP
ncbi:hypothetical protein BGX30_007016 [Mortierella sp. GBA39]|nr:hypothetical protein BGX30_007016 [Mortierella sp. GBA39]